MKKVSIILKDKDFHEYPEVENIIYKDGYIVFVLSNKDQAVYQSNTFETISIEEIHENRNTSGPFFQD
ncbi:hypothetical protein AAEX28_07320 [Lentisphaerota bacterium WC36G]|nr:hypothetical protein LJT99_10180 [Lentisphaerae bacterium WC36]UDQ97786.1 hypothetical protein LJT99_15225 [Lentisphaerae bacterium WC36]